MVPHKISASGSFHIKDLQDRHLITYNMLGHDKLVKFKIKGWCKYNRILDYNAPCQKDTGFSFFLYQ